MDRPVQTTISQIQDLDMAVTWKSHSGEFRVTYTALDMPDPEAREAAAYYTDLSSDALATAAAMRADLDYQRETAAESERSYSIAPEARAAVEAVAALAPDPAPWVASDGQPPRDFIDITSDIDAAFADEDARRSARASNAPSITSDGHPARDFNEAAGLPTTPPPLDRDRDREPSGPDDRGPPSSPLAAARERNNTPEAKAARAVARMVGRDTEHER